MIEIEFPVGKDEEEEILFETQKKGSEDNAEISLHAMDGCVTTQTIRLKGHINNKPVSILIDNGFTHNFVYPKVVQRTGLLLIPEPSFNVRIAGDDKLQSEGLCQSVSIKCQGKEIITDFHMLPIGGCQMVLGVELLQKFKAVTLSYKDQNVKLSSGSNVWEFQGIQTGEIELVQAESMDKSVMDCVCV